MNRVEEYLEEEGRCVMRDCRAPIERGEDMCTACQAEVIVRIAEARRLHIQVGAGSRPRRRLKNDCLDSREDWLERNQRPRFRVLHQVWRLA